MRDAAAEEWRQVPQRRGHGVIALARCAVWCAAEHGQIVPCISYDVRARGKNGKGLLGAKRGDGRGGNGRRKGMRTKGRRRTKGVYARACVYARAFVYARACGNELRALWKGCKNY